MRRYLLLLLFISYNLCMGQQSVREPNDDGTYSVGVVDKDGNRTGDWKKHYSSGKVFISMSYVNGLLEGKVISYYKNGNIQAENDYIEGKLNGISKQYDIKGTPIREISYKENLIFGNCKYYENGVIDNERYYKNGVVDGPCKDYRKGKLIREYIQNASGRISDMICYDLKTGKKKNCGFL